MTDLSMNPEGSSGDGNGGVTAMAGRVQMSLYGLDGAPIVAAWCLQRSYINPYHFLMGRKPREKCFCFFFPVANVSLAGKVHLTPARQMKECSAQKGTISNRKS